MKFKVKEATLDDYERIKPIHKMVHELHVNGRPDRYKLVENTLDKDYFRGLIEGEDGSVFIVEQEKEIIAFAFVRETETPKRATLIPKKNVFIEDFGVDEKYRGKGLGRMLFNKAHDLAKDINADSLELGVWEFNEEAREFYETMGMTTQARKMELKIK
ncbi:GNAT family N-acetyltransferase [Virgibacillus kekensis]|uniref:GNAT family N-acetyltransferase n=1 Tax=Virgibacillus kekensis TaxID=202261 RepID=A0ABV9DQ56_9BACI